MGLIDGLFGLLFGGSRNVVRETAEVFRVNAEAEAGRELSLQSDALKQFAAEFDRANRSGFDRFMDGLNRVPRPAMALGTIGLFIAAMLDPVWFSARMSGLALVPEPLWWLLAAIVSFYFGARHQAKGQQFQRDLATTLARAPVVVDTVRNIEALRAPDPVSQDDGVDPLGPAQDPKPRTGPMADATPAAARSGDPNPALADWRAAAERADRAA